MRTRKKFTLIELLVVIAIIAILASMLLPALQKARGKTLSAACTSQEKQICLGTFMYTQDYDGYFPTEHAPGGGLGMAPDTVTDPGTVHGGFWISGLRPYLSDDKLWECPAWKQKIWATCPANHRYVSTYQMNFETDKRAIFHVKAPASKIFMKEANMYCGVWWPGCQQWNCAMPKDLHNGGYNCGFVDGHVRWVTWNYLHDPGNRAKYGDFDKDAEGN